MNELMAHLETQSRLHKQNGANALAKLFDAARNRIVELEKEKLLLVEDRARFPDKPDMIGRMIDSNSKNKDALIDAHKKACEAQRLRAEVANNKIAELEKDLDENKQTKTDLYRILFNHIDIDWSLDIDHDDIESAFKANELEQQAKGVLDAVEYLGWDDLYTDSCPGQNIGRKFRFVAGKLNKEAEALKAGKL